MLYSTIYMISHRKILLCYNQSCKFSSYSISGMFVYKKCISEVFHCCRNYLRDLTLSTNYAFRILPLDFSDVLLNFKNFQLDLIDITLYVRVDLCLQEHSQRNFSMLQTISEPLISKPIVNFREVWTRFKFQRLFLNAIDHLYCFTFMSRAQIVFFLYIRGNLFSLYLKLHSEILFWC